MDEAREQVFEDIRSCLISSKGGVPISQINREYKMILGNTIPFSKFGHTNLESFLRSVPGLNVCIKGGELFLEAMPTKNTVHISAMVRGQKSTARRKPAPPPRYQKVVRKPFSNMQTPARRVILPANSQRRKTPSPTQLASLSRSNLPPRLKTSHSHPQMDPVLAQNFVGQRKPGDRRSFEGLEMPTFQADPSLIHGNPMQPLSPLESNLTVSSVLRTPTAVMGPSSPIMGDFRVSSSTPRSPPPLIPPLLSLNMQPVIPKRNSAQARLQRQIPAPFESEVEMPLPHAPYETISLFPKTNDVHPPKVSSPPEVTKRGYRATLDEYCRVKLLSIPVYKVLTSFPKSKAKQIVCSIKIGVEHGFSSYPTECKTEEEAIEVASQTALEALQKIYGILGESLPVTKDENLIASRVALMLDDHPNGLWSSQVPADYREIHKETLPEGWLDILRTSPLITIDHAAHNRFILLPNRSSSARGCSTPSSTTSSGIMDDSLNKLEDLSLKSENQATEPSNDEAVTTMGQLNLPEDECWNVFVSYATSTSNVWIRLIGEEYSALYDEMAADMELFYMSGGGKIAKDLVIGHYYALQVDDCWHRVELMELSDGSKEATCFFVDNGDDEVHDASELRVLEPNFMKLHCQAIQSRLTGLEEFASDQSVEGLLVENIIGRNLVAKATVGESEDDGENRPFPSLILYDTSTDENVNLNDVLLEKILQNTVSPSLNKNGKIQDAYVSYISKSGSFFVQLSSSIFDYMTKMIEDYSCNIALDSGDNTGKVTPGVTSVSPDVMYLARYEVDKLWYRAVIDSKRPGYEVGKVWVKFVDYGNAELTSLKDLVALPSSHVLSKLPYQAIECCLHNMGDQQFTQKGLDRCREIISSEEPVLIKVVPATSDSAIMKRKYEVEIFKRVQPDNLLVSVGVTLSMEEGVFEKKTQEIKKLNDDLKEPGMKSPKSNESFQKPSNVKLDSGNVTRVSAPKIPKVGELFDVHVTIAANPGNFTVQPWKDVTKFRSMMSAMQSVYNSSSKSVNSVSISPEEIETCRQPLDMSKIKEGGVYAALHDDQMWYRITVSQLIIDVSSLEGGMVSAYFVDYGDVAAITLDKIRNLAPEFYALPYQAIKAKLSGIVPIHSDWSVEDCLRFQEMVCDKEFVAKVVETGPDVINLSDTVIGIHLTDTSDPNVDSSIGQILVDEGRALPC
ncbi:hypothetical protein J437_LFUL003077 [Ladona fulva]|uniref:Tudor domain-containing protein 7 n=1 Tax=Ladona fulva TaxID=123851 RepID=A0A8K0NWV9_LADFU|nr:hypothetical protein J437_LFUL003077 [Ladona fulva]